MESNHPVQGFQVFLEFYVAFAIFVYFLWMVEEYTYVLVVQWEDALMVIWVRFPANINFWLHLFFLFKHNDYKHIEAEIS